MGEQRNLFLALGLALIVMVTYQFLFLEPANKRAREAREAAAAREVVEAVSAETGATGELGELGEDALPSTLAPRAPAPEAEEPRAVPRVSIDTPALSGSISLVGARIDDLQLKRYGEGLDKDSPRVRLFSPVASDEGYYAFHGWAGDAPGLPDNRTRWDLVEGEPTTLTPATPIRLIHTTAEGLTFERRISIDDDYMFTITDRVANQTGADLSLQPYGVVRRLGAPERSRRSFGFEGLIGIIGGDRKARNYRKLAKEPLTTIPGVGGWVGVTDKYWLAALAPPPGAAVTGELRMVARATGAPTYQSSYAMEAVTAPDGDALEVTTRLFAGAKRVDLLNRYAEEYSIPRLNEAVDWGIFWFLTKPFFYILHQFGQIAGNFGLAILMLTVCVKIVFFPLANQSYKAMARMKALQPKMQELRERFKADQQRQQQELVELYKREKVNPLAGCLPILVQIPVFFALYNTLQVSLEMRHEPFIGWIRDLSAPDPTNLWNLFGLLPYDPASIPLLGGFLGGAGFLAIGVWPIVMGLSMAAMQTLNPPPPDPTQQKIFAFMPLMFTFILAPFAAGLVIYWTWNNTLSFAQQYLIMRRQGVDTPIGSFIARRLGRKPAAGT